MTTVQTQSQNGFLSRLKKHVVYHSTPALLFLLLAHKKCGENSPICWLLPSATHAFVTPPIPKTAPRLHYIHFDPGGSQSRKFSFRNRRICLWCVESMEQMGFL